MARKKRVLGAEFKAKVALAAVQEQKTVQQIATLFEVHPTQVQVWKKQLLLGAAGVFQASGGPQALAQRSREAELFEQIGRLNMELDWLKKKLAGLD